MAHPLDPPLIVAIGGTTKPGSTTELALAVAVQAAEAAGARVQLFDGAFLARLPHYDPAAPRTADEQALIAAARAADGFLIASPAYHGGVSGLVKNAIDLLEELKADPRPYFDGCAVGCIATAYGPQGGGPVLAGLRAIVHAMRGWPTPCGGSVQAAPGLFASDGACTNPKVAEQLATVGRQVAQFGLWRRAALEQVA
jgi:FMN reductase